MNTKISLLLFLVIMLTGVFHMNATSTPIPQSNYTVQSFSTDNETHPVAHAFDDDDNTWWAIYNADGFSLPGIVELDLGAVHDVSGFSYLPNPANSGDKAIGYEMYVSSDGVEWGTPETAGDFFWSDASDVSRQDIYFGSISAQFVKVVYTSSQNTSNNNIHTGDLYIYESDIEATGQINQLLSFGSISPKYASDDPFELTAVTDSELPIEFSIVSGPATVLGAILTLSGTGGIVEVSAFQAGDDTYYSAESIQSFLVTDLAMIEPVVSTRLSEVYPLEMPELYQYPVYINAAINEPEQLSITGVEVEIDGVTMAASGDEGFYYVLWTPGTYGSHEVNITATASNGNTSTISKDILVTDDYSSQNILTMEDVVIEFGGENSRWYYGEYSMPQHVGSYDEIIANLTIECPAGNCDDWDRLAYIDVKGPDGNWIQIIRYITPYGVACNHDLDVTDYASILQGDFEFRMFIDTWGTGGWQVTLDFDHQEGEPQYLYSKVDEIWDGRWDLGNPANPQPVDTIDYFYGSNILSSHLRLSNTGHGWGENNSQNAAEFYHATNFIDLNGIEEIAQDLWNVCSPNPDNCTGQLGTWTYSRAGWCPGAISPPNIWDMTAFISTDPLELIYRFDPSYTDFCHPNNPDCVSGVTCTNCNDGYKAIYEVDGHLINYSNTPLVAGVTGIDYIDNTLAYDLTIYPNPNNGRFKLSTSNVKGEIRLRIHSISGEVIQTFHFKNERELNNQSFDISTHSSGVYFISIENNAGTGVARVVVE